MTINTPPMIGAYILKMFQYFHLLYLNPTFYTSI